MSHSVVAETNKEIGFLVDAWCDRRAIGPLRVIRACCPLANNRAEPRSSMITRSGARWSNALANAVRLSRQRSTICASVSANSSSNTSLARSIATVVAAADLAVACVADFRVLMGTSVWLFEAVWRQGRSPFNHSRGPLRMAAVDFNSSPQLLLGSSVRFQHTSLSQSIKGKVRHAQFRQSSNNGGVGHLTCTLRACHCFSVWSYCSGRSYAVAMDYWVRLATRSLPHSRPVASQHRHRSCSLTIRSRGRLRVGFSKLSFVAAAAA